jgi:hypothetical protein
MEDEKEEKKPSWKHDQELNFNGARNHLQTLATVLQKAIEMEKAKLANLVGVRDSYKK